MKKFRTFLFIFYFFDLFVVDFKVLIKLSSIFFKFISLTTLSSLGSNLVIFKILIFRRDILKNVCKRIFSVLHQKKAGIPSSQILNLKKN